MKEPMIEPRLSRRTVLVGAASLVLLAPALTREVPAARAASPRLTYGYGYAGGY